MTAQVPRIPIVVKNDSGAIIPPRSIVVVTSVETIAKTNNNEQTVIHHVTQYGCGVAGNVFVTGPNAIKIGNRGVAYADQFIYVSIDSGVFAPVSGEEWGPVDGSWTITRGGVGFFAQGYSATGASPDRSMFLRTFNRADPSDCSTSSNSVSSTSSGSSSVSGSSTTSVPCACVTVVTEVSCSGSGLNVRYGIAGGCCQ